MVKKIHDHKTILALVAEGRLSYRQIAQQLGISNRNTVGGIVHYAKRKPKRLGRHKKPQPKVVAPKVELPDRYYRPVWDLYDD